MLAGLLGSVSDLIKTLFFFFLLFFSMPAHFSFHTSIIWDGLLASIFDNSFMFLFTLYLNTHGTSLFGKIRFGGGK